MRNTDLDKNRRFLFNFITSYSILLIIILIMGLFLYNIGIKDAKSNIYSQNRTLLKSSVADIDNAFVLMSTLSSQFTSDSSIRALTKMDTSDSEFYITAQTCMNILSKNISLINTLPVSDYYIFLTKTGYMLHSGHLSDSHFGYSSNRISSESSYSDWLNIITSEDNNRKLILLNDVTAETEPSYLYKLPLSDYSLYRNYNAFLCFSIDDRSLKAYFSNVELYNNGFIYICDSSGKMQFAIYDSTVVSSDEINAFSEYVASIYSTGSEFDSYSGMLDSLSYKDMLITTTISGYNNWAYILVQPQNLVFSSLLNYQRTYSIIIITACFFCCLLIYLLSKKNVKPILQIHNQLETSIVRENALKEALEKQQPIIYSTLVSRLMKGLVYTKDEVNEISSVLSLTEKNVKYCVLYINFYSDNYDAVSEDSHHPDTEVIEMTEYKQAIQDMLYNFFGKDILFFEPDINSFAVLLASDDDISFKEFSLDIKEAFTGFHIAVMDAFSIWSLAGLGNRNYDLAFIWKSYQQAYEAISYISGKSIFECFADIKRDASFYYYPFEMAQQLSNFITAGNAKQVSEIFRLIRKENFENRSLPLSVSKWLISDIRNTLLKVRYSINVTADNSSLISTVDSAFTEEKTLDTLEDTALKLCTLFCEKAEGAGNKLIASIQMYLDENFKDSSLSLKKISEEFSISESYFSYLFKAEVGQNFSEYLEQLRMEHAMQLLKETDIGISDLYLEVGYNNANSFRRAFKKVHGVSPKTIRDSVNN